MKHDFGLRGTVLKRSVVLCAVALMTGCAPTVTGTAVSPVNDPFHVADLPAKDGPSGLRPDAPAAVGKVKNTNNSDVDRLALQAINDIAEYWQQDYTASGLKGSFTPIEKFVSYDARDRNSPVVCDDDTAGLVNAFYCPSEKLMAWDRGVMVPTGRKYFGDISVAGVIAHEYGHAIQYMAKAVTRSTPVIVREQQADCFAGAYLHYVGAGDSKRFMMSTGDGLNHVLAGLITIRDPTLGPHDDDMLTDGHGTALDRVSAFQQGFTSGPKSCAAIDLADVKQRRKGLPMELQEQPTDNKHRSSDLPVDKDTVGTVVELLNALYSPKQPPKLTYGPAKCDVAQGDSPASYCPSTNTIAVNLPALQQLGAPADMADKSLIQGDNTAFSIVVSRYMLALENQRGAKLDTPTAALRTACLTAQAQRKMAKPKDLPSGKSLQLTAGDLDKAVAGLLINGYAATAVDGEGVPAAFTRIAAFRAGLATDDEGCYQRYQ
ncbi:peptidase [Mycobacterium sp. CBMA 234]|uniref:neutral zinc metallopeptidase n=1 Tax=Mycolicibacterium sp. CBMA 234 TaxID=1918495 RepID=UPI0012DF1BC3|nr:neutral zinc metallopeptidase [Mycolicibacterium sp. CBMA 234]MUL67340.1 peptidase [Mycolicibacterium sp. CBMA 234]